MSLRVILVGRAAVAAIIPLKLSRGIAALRDQTLKSELAGLAVQLFVRLERKLSEAVPRDWRIFPFQRS
jgi:hypothetical protein